MPTYTQKATTRRDNGSVVTGKGEALKLIPFIKTVTIAAATAAGATIDFGQIPSNARIVGASKVYWDAISTAATTLDLGLGPVDANITTDPDALNDGLVLSAASTANVGAFAIKDLSNFGKKAYEHVNGQATDPGGLLTVYGSLLDQPYATGGDITLEMYYYVD
jgi:hypothetical protein